MKSKKVLTSKRTNKKRSKKLGLISSLVKFNIRKPGVLFVVLFAAVGSLVLLRSYAATPGVITGVAFIDANRNGIFDAGEQPRVNDRLYVFNADSGSLAANIVTDEAGHYSTPELPGGNYNVDYSSGTWWDLRKDYVSTTSTTEVDDPPRIVVSLSQPSVTANFGWRKIVSSTSLDNPISTFTGPSGLVVRAYNDAVSAKSIHDKLAQGTLFGEEAKHINIRFGYFETTWSTTSTACSETQHTSNATIGFNYENWTDGADNVLFHEYGHAWSLYYDCTAQIQEPFMKFSGYLKARGLYEDSRINTSYSWSVSEMIAEDYRQLFGSPAANVCNCQTNRDIPLAKDVVGLREYLAGEYMRVQSSTPTGDTISPSTPTNLVGFAQSGPSVNLSWTDSSDNVGVAGYEVFRAGTKVGFSTNNTYVDGSSESPLGPGTTYQYYLFAVDAAGNRSQQSSSIMVTTSAQDEVAPTAPSNLSAYLKTKNSIGLTWAVSGDNVGVVEYRVYQVNRRGPETLVATVTANSALISSLKAGTSYNFYVVAVDGAGNVSEPSSLFSVKTPRR